MNVSMDCDNGNISQPLARRRWGLLQQAILKKTLPEAVGNSASKRVFQRFSDIVNWTYSDSTSGVLNIAVQTDLKAIESPNFQQENSKNQLLKGICKEEIDHKPIQDHNQNVLAPFPVYFFQLYPSKAASEKQLDIKNLTKTLDLTGQLCIWPAEQILCYWVLKNQSFFEGKRVIEIGGGFHCLGGLAVAKYTSADYVVLTDGDEENVEQINRSLQLNNIAERKCVAKLLRWEERKDKSEFEGKFDIVIAADVVYHQSYFDCLLKTVSFLLKPNGRFLLFNPRRNGILHEFVGLAKCMKNFSNVKFTEDYDMAVTKVAEDLSRNDSSFNREWHYPIQVLFSK
ncbi:unnamed protein product [Orchesella dallaii]|uniref:Calmodulin-lysine N-methyltransferase n=1 Tax=Orchesella dallaii TaxID=48710 RepID=A0ABP1RJP8_9HEXA